MGNSLTNRTKTPNGSTYAPSILNKNTWKRERYRQEYELRSKTLPIRSSAPAVNLEPTAIKSLPKTTKTATTSATATSAQNAGETSRVLFLLYLIHRTWNVLTDNKSKSSHHSQSMAKTVNDSAYFESSDCSLAVTDLQGGGGDSISQCCSQYSLCSCSSCYNELQQQNIYSSIDEEYSQDSIGEKAKHVNKSDLSLTSQRYQMAPSVCQNSPKLPPHNGNGNGAISSVSIVNGGSGTFSITQHSNCGASSINGSMASYKMSSSENSWSQITFSKENQRPPVYNPEDYVLSLKKFGKRQNGANTRSIYDTNDLSPNTEEVQKSTTLPLKHSDYKNPIMSPPVHENEMSLRQFSSITDLLTKLRADLRVSFPSFVQEFVATPSDGISLLLEVLRSIQLSQTTNAPMTAIPNASTMPRHSQSYQRRALLDELACLQCISICCSRSLEATARLGNTPVGLMPLAASATGQGIRARILAMQLMAAACDKQAFGHGNQKSAQAGHTAVSEAMSTLRLRCSEPVRFRLLMGMLNSGGGSGELQAMGIRFINAFLESSENLQQRLYLQAELFQAGFDPHNLCKTISSSSPWLDALRNELKHFNDIYVDIDKMIAQAREAERVRSQMVILERRVQILHEEKAVLTSMERRLQERCAELQREIFRLQGAQNESGFKSLDKQEVTLPPHIPPGKQEASEHEDEGISSSDTGPSLSPVPILVLPHLENEPEKNANKSVSADTIEAAMKELDKVVNEAEKQICSSETKFTSTLSCNDTKEKDIVPVNIVPQPPRKSRSLAHLVPHEGSELDGSEYGMLLIQKQVEQTQDERVAAIKTFFDETDYELQEIEKSYHRPSLESPEMPETDLNRTQVFAHSNTRELLDVIMNARHSEDDPTIKALREIAATSGDNNTDKDDRDLKNGETKCHNFTEVVSSQTRLAQQFNGVFFMTGMNTPQKYPKPDLTAALQARRVTKNVERLEAAFASHNESYNLECLTVAHNNQSRKSLTPNQREKSRSNQQIYFGSNPTLRIGSYTSINHNINNSRPDLLNQTNITTRTRSYTQGAKVTDIPSGLY